MLRINSNRLHVKLFFLLLILYLYTGILAAQPALSPNTFNAVAIEPIQFGDFYDLGGGGTITVDWQGTRSTTGDILARPGSIVRPALFKIVVCQGGNVTISFEPTTTLTTSNGDVLVLDIGPTEKGLNGALFALTNNCNFKTTIRVGGTLHIPENSTTGIFTGSFEIYFKQQ
jgi:hypothetical protein